MILSLFPAHEDFTHLLLISYPCWNPTITSHLSNMWVNMGQYRQHFRGKWCSHLLSPKIAPRKKKTQMLAPKITTTSTSWSKSFNLPWLSKRTSYPYLIHCQGADQTGRCWNRAFCPRNLGQLIRSQTSPARPHSTLGCLSLPRAGDVTAGQGRCKT